MRSIGSMYLDWNVDFKKNWNAYFFTYEQRQQSKVFSSKLQYNTLLKIINLYTVLKRKRMILLELFS